MIERDFMFLVDWELKWDLLWWIINNSFKSTHRNHISIQPATTLKKNVGFPLVSTRTALITKHKADLRKLHWIVQVNRFSDNLFFCFHFVYSAMTLILQLWDYFLHIELFTWGIFFLFIKSWFKSGQWKVIECGSLSG